MNKFFLAIVMSLSGLWRTAGADTEQLRAILTAKLKMDDRKPLAYRKAKEGKEYNYSTLLNMLIHVVTGLMYTFPLFIFSDTIVAMYVYFTIFLFLLTFSLITDFSNVIIDSSDKYVLVPRPVNDRTIFLSRNLYVFIYLLRIVLPMSLPGWVVLAISHGWPTALLFPFTILFMTFISLFLVNGVYLLILKISKPERFKNIIGGFQIAFTIFIIILYNLLQSISQKPEVQHLDISQYDWVRFTPPYWLAACWSWIGYKAVLPGTVWLGLLAVVFPVFCLWFTLKFLAPSFGRKIAAIDGVEVHELSPAKPAKRSRSTMANKLANLFVKTDAGRAGFIMAWWQTSRSRSFKMKVYPAFAYVPIYFVYMLFLNDESFSDIIAALPRTKIHLFLLYMSAFAMMQALNYVTVSDQYKAAWIYYSAPVSVPGHVLTGAFKALWVRYCLPFLLFIGAIVVYIWGADAIIDVLLAAINVTVFTVCVMRTTNRSFPFSQKEQMKNAGMKGFFRGLLTMVLIAVMGFAHYFLSVFWWLKILFIILSSIFLWLVWDSCLNTSWQVIAKGDDE